MTQKDENFYAEETTKAFEQLTKNLKSFQQQTPQGSNFNLAFNLLAQMTSQTPNVVDQSIVQSIIKILETLEKNLDTSRKIELSQKEQRDKKLQEKIDGYEIEVSEKLNDLGSKKDELRQLNKKVEKIKSQLDVMKVELKGKRLDVNQQKIVCEEEYDKHKQWNIDMILELTQCEEAIEIM